MKKYTREELVQICKDAVVPCEKWDDRDSYMAQLSISHIHALLMAGAKFVVEKDKGFPDTLHVKFRNLTQEQKEKFKEHQLEIDSRKDYFTKMDPEYETEMFDGIGIDVESDYLRSYMPTRKRLDEKKGNDWY